MRVERQQPNRLPAGGRRWRIWVWLPHVHDVPVEKATEAYGLAESGLRERHQGPVEGLVYLGRNGSFGVEASGRADADKVEDDEAERQSCGQAQAVRLAWRGVFRWGVGHHEVTSRSEGDVPAVVHLPNVENVPVKYCAGSRDVAQRIKRHVKVGRRLGNVAVIDEAYDRPDTEQVDRETDCDPQRDALGSAREAGPVERRFHVSLGRSVARGEREIQLCV